MWYLIVSTPDLCTFTYFVELILDCSVTVNRQTLKLDEDVIREVEKLSRYMCYSLHQKRCEILGLILRK